MQTALRFTPEYTQRVLVKACARAGLDATSARLVRMGENALYHLADAHVMARVGRSLRASHKEVAIARWLSHHEFPAASIIPEVDQPVVIDTTPVTFWQFIDESAEAVTSVDLGSVLRRLHGLEAPLNVDLPPFEPMPKVDNRLAAYGSHLRADHLNFLHTRKDELESAFRHLRFELGYGPIHGDAHAANLMRDLSGVVRLIDFEDFCHGPREWDVCVEAVRFHALGWVSDASYRAYVHSYGFDPLTWPGFDVVCAIRELNMTTWLLQMIGQSSDIDQEISTRIDDLRSGARPRHWKTF